ncbi:MAG TPA: PhzF family phenazine biosynthesis protein [Candidatus Polarisedimenticolia bacterium]|jgi:trans-2,3-dihydro-3-hydroxyanthranilate isomerase|nr:PhzF family phenazine biosynthesis protein [Candidatus Polarisedimenticolia bacterium]
MKRLRFVTCDVFTDRPFGGNPLAVFPGVSGLDTATMQAIAREFNFSETTFVEAATTSGCTCKVRIFTPRNELKFAGHPTLGTAHVLAHSVPPTASPGGHLDLVFEEGVGPVPVRVTLDAGRPVFAELTAAKLPEAGPTPPDAATLARVLSLEPSDLLGGAFTPQSFSAGIPFLYVPLKSRAALERARIDKLAWEEALSKYVAPDCFVFTFGDGGPLPQRAGAEPIEIRARMFAPAEGIEEDPATGSAAAALAGYLAPHDDARATTLRWTVHQGVEMGRPSLLQVKAERGPKGLASVKVGGATVIMTEGEFILS